MCVSVCSLKGEVLCSQKDFRMNLYIPGNGDMILLRSRSEDESHPVKSLHVHHDAADQQLEEEEEEEGESNQHQSP